MAEPASKFDQQAQPKPPDIKEDAPTAVIGFRRRFDITEKPDAEQAARTRRGAGGRYAAPPKPISYAPSASAYAPPPAQAGMQDTVAGKSTDGIVQNPPVPEPLSEPVAEPVSAEQALEPKNADRQGGKEEARGQRVEDEELGEGNEADEEDEGEAEQEAEDEEAEEAEATAAQQQEQAKQEAQKKKHGTAIVGDIKLALAGKAFVEGWWEQMLAGVPVLWAAPILNCYILIGLFSKSPFWHQLSKIRIVIILMLDMLLFLLLLILILVIMKWVCSGFSGAAIKFLSFFSDRFAFCSQLDKVLNGIQVPQ